jgi:transcriptional regulator with XRE-family HTH domain
VQRGFTLDDAARVLECDRSKVSRIETGQRGIRCKELRELLAAYGATDEQQAILSAPADPRDAFGWHREYADVLPGAWQDYLILEAGASKICVYEAQRIPALLQTPAYANWPKRTPHWRMMVPVPGPSRPCLPGRRRSSAIASRAFTW